MPAAPSPRRGPALDRVEIVGGQAGDTEARRQSTASKIVIGREELDRMGDGTVADVLKRLPGVTLGGRPGRGGEIRMRGLGSGYTQILVNGERVPFGFSVDSLAPEQIERIEVSRAPTAETGARAVAGTINLILREDVKRRLNELKASLSSEAGRQDPSLSWTRADQVGPVSYNLSANVFRKHQVDASSVVTAAQDGSGDLVRTQEEERHSLSRRAGLHLGGRVLWRLGEGENVSLMPFLVSSRGTSQGTASLSQPFGSVPPDWSSAQTSGDSDFTLARLNGQWQGRLAGNRVEVRGGANRSISHSHSLRDQSGGAAPQDQQDAASVNESGWSSAMKLSRNLGTDHRVALGWEGEGSRRNDVATTRVVDSLTGAPVTAAGSDGDNLGARTWRNAAWAQDEWDFSPTWSAYAGLRWEGIETRADSVSGAPVHNRSRVWSPLLHSVWKLDEAAKDQLRLALTRSYRSPTLSNLVARPRLALDNTATQPDRIGNPVLQPELATGLDLAFDHYFSAGGLVSVSLFDRRIKGLIRSRISQDASTGRWVSQPQNVGDARTRGIEAEAKFRLAEIVDESAGPAPNVDLRSNVALYRSRVSGIDAADNRLDQQPRASLNLGADWKLRTWPLTLGGNYSWTPDNHVTLSTQAGAGGTDQRIASSAKRALDAYALWTFGPTLQLRASVANILAEDAITVSTVSTTSSSETARTTAQTWRVWSLRLELRL